MSESDSQNRSARDYEGSVNVGSFSVSSFDSVLHEVEAFSGEQGTGDFVEEEAGPAESSGHHSPAARTVTTPLVTEEAGTSGRGKSPRAVHRALSLLADLPADSRPPTSTRLKPLSSEGLARHECLLTLAEMEDVSSLLTGRVKFSTRRDLGNIMARHEGDWLGIHLDSLRAPLTFPFHPFLLGFIRYYGVMPGQISPNAHRILACFPQICGRHGLSCTLTLFRYVFSVRPLSPKHGGGVLCIQSRGHLCSIINLPDNNKGWKDRILSIEYPWSFPIPRVWATHFTEHKKPASTRQLQEAGLKISSEFYDYRIFRSASEYGAAGLQDPVYNLEEKYEPKPVTVTVAAAPPEEGMRPGRGFPAPAVPTAPATKISLGSKKANPAVPTAIPTTVVQAAAPAQEAEGSRLPEKRGKEKVDEPDIEEIPVKRTRRASPSTRTPIIDLLVEDSDSHPAALLDKLSEVVPVTAVAEDCPIDEVGEKIARELLQAFYSTTSLFVRARNMDEAHQKEVAALKKALQRKDAKLKEATVRAEKAEERAGKAETRAEQAEAQVTALSDPALMATEVCRELTSAETFLRSFLKNQTGEDLLYTYATWAFNNGQRTMRAGVVAALTAAVEEDDLTQLLAVLPQEVPDPGPAPYSEGAEGQAAETASEHRETAS